MSLILMATGKNTLPYNGGQNSSLNSFNLALPRTTNPRTRQAPSDRRSVSSRNLANFGGAKGFRKAWLRMAVLKCVSRI